MPTIDMKFLSNPFVPHICPTETILSIYLSYLLSYLWQYEKHKKRGSTTISGDYVEK